MSTRRYEPGQRVIYVDHQGQAHEALTTAMWGSGPGPDGVGVEPAVNLIYVAADEQKTDTYGRQVARDTSVPHKTMQTAPGNFWLWPEA